MQNDLLKIGEFSKLSRISVRMLRHYDDIGLLKPAETDRFTGYRYYKYGQLAAAGQIRSLRDIGFSLSAVGEILHCGGSAAVEELFRTRERELLVEAAETAYRLRLLDSAMKRQRKEGYFMNYNVSLKTIPERTAACVRMTIPSYEDEAMAWDVLMSETAEMELVPDEPCLCCVTFYDDEFKESEVDVEITKTVRGKYGDTEHVKFRTLPPATVASAVHNGSYAGLDDAMRAVAEWVCENGYELSDAPFNIYHVSPYETDDPERFVTEICYPVKKA